MKPEHLLRLYPRAWRERYGDEFVALVETSGLSARVVINIVGAAVRERCFEVVGSLGWVPRIVGLYALVVAVLLLLATLSPRADFNFWDLELHASLFEAFAFVCLALHVASRMWVTWRPVTGPRSVADRVAAQVFVGAFSLAACYIAQALMPGPLLLLSHAPFLPAVFPVAYLVVPDALTFRPRPRLIGCAVVRGDNAPGSFLGLGPGASA